MFDRALNTYLIIVLTTVSKFSAPKELNTQTLWCTTRINTSFKWYWVKRLSLMF